MGDYYSLRFKGTVKPEYREDFEDIAMEGAWFESEVPMFREFGRIDRAMFIPCGRLAYSPNSWGDDFHANYGFDRTYNPETGYWTFQCCIKTCTAIRELFRMAPDFLESIEYAEWSFEYNNYAHLITMDASGELSDNKVTYNLYDSDEDLYSLWKEHGIDYLLERNDSPAFQKF